MFVLVFAIVFFGFIRPAFMIVPAMHERHAERADQ